MTAVAGLQAKGKKLQKSTLDALEAIATRTVVTPQDRRRVADQELRLVRLGGTLNAASGVGRRGRAAQAFGPRPAPSRNSSRNATPVPNRARTPAPNRARTPTPNRARTATPAPKRGRNNGGGSRNATPPAPKRARTAAATTPNRATTPAVDRYRSNSNDIINLTFSNNNNNGARRTTPPRRTSSSSFINLVSRTPTPNRNNNRNGNGNNRNGNGNKGGPPRKKPPQKPRRPSCPAGTGPPQRGRSAEMILLEAVGRREMPAAKAVAMLTEELDAARTILRRVMRQVGLDTEMARALRSAAKASNANSSWRSNRAANLTRVDARRTACVAEMNKLNAYVTRLRSAIDLLEQPDNAVRERNRLVRSMLNRDVLRGLPAATAAPANANSPSPFQVWMSKAVRSDPRSSLGQFGAAANAQDDPCADAADPVPGRSGLHEHQKVVRIMAELRAQGKIDTSGLLVVHSTGAGKTIAGLSVLLAFWDSTYVHAGQTLPWPVLFVSTKDNQEDNDAAKLARYAMLIFADFTTADGSRPFARRAGDAARHWDDAEAVKRAAYAITTRLKLGIQGMMRRMGQEPSATQLGRGLYTYIKLANDLGSVAKSANGQVVPAGPAFVAPDNVTFIVDEIQYLVSPPLEETTWKDSYTLVLNHLTKRRNPANTWVVGMTATPGETKEEVVAVLAAVQGPVKERQVAVTDSLDTLAAKARGYVSYAYLLNDARRFARVDLRLECSNLTDSAYYHDPYIRRLYRLYASVPEFQGASFLEKVYRERPEWWQKLKAKAYDASKARAAQRDWWVYNPLRPNAYLKRVRDASLFIMLDKEETVHLQSVLKDGPEENNNNNERPKGRRRRRAKAHKWPPAELLEYVSTSQGGAMAANARNNGDNSEDDEVVTVENATLAKRRVKNEQLRRTGRVRTGVQQYFRRYLLSPKITQFLAIVYDDLMIDKKGIHYVYTSSPTAALLVAQALTTVLRLPQLKRNTQQRAGVQYFCMIDDVASQVPGLDSFRTAAGDVPMLKRLASSDLNKFGDVIKVVIATKKSFKGVDLRNVRHLHLLDAFANFRDFIQFVGRGPRNCSHSGLPRAQQRVTVHLYRLQYSSDDACTSSALADCFLATESLKRYTAPGGYQDVETKVLWGASVDYLVHRDTLHKDMASLATMVRDLQCKPQPRPPGFQELESKVLEYRTDKYDKLLREKYKLPPKKPHVKGRKEYLAGLTSIRAMPNGNARAQALQALRAEYPNAARSINYDAATKDLYKDLKKATTILVNAEARAANAANANAANAAAAVATARNTVQALRANAVRVQNEYAQLPWKLFKLNLNFERARLGATNLDVRTNDIRNPTNKSGR